MFFPFLNIRVVFSSSFLPLRGRLKTKRLKTRVPDYFVAGWRRLAVSIHPATRRSLNINQGPNSLLTDDLPIHDNAQPHILKLRAFLSGMFARSFPACHMLFRVCAPGGTSSKFGDEVANRMDRTGVAVHLKQTGYLPSISRHTTSFRLGTSCIHLHTLNSPTLFSNSKPSFIVTDL